MKSLIKSLCLLIAVAAVLVLAGCSPAAEEVEETPQASQGDGKFGQSNSTESATAAPLNPSGAPSKE